MSFTSELRSALDLRNQKESADSVHRIVLNGLRELDPQARLQQTGYFNHSWAPDFVATWDGGTAERHVFLRFDVAHEAFRRELDLLGQESPVFLGLLANGVTPAPEKLEATVADAAREHDTLVTESQAVEQLQEGVSVRKDARTATRALLRGGRGLVDRAAASSIVARYADVVSEIEGERRSGEVRSALNDIEAFFTENATLVFERALRSRWIGAGGSPFDFPGLESWNLASRTPEEIADLVEALLDQPEPVPPAQWREIAASVSADALGLALRSRQSREGGRLNELLRSALDIWNAQWVYARPLPADTFEGVHDWFVSTYGFGLRMLNREAFFSDDGRRFSQVASDSQLPEIATRGPLLRDPAIKGIGLVTPQEDVSIALRESATHSIGDLIDDLVAKDSPIWRSALIAEMGVELASYGAEARIDFRRNLVVATRPIPLRTLISLVARYVSALPESDLEELDRAMTLTN